MPCYPALALLIGAGIARGGKPVVYGARAIAIVSTLGFVAVAGILIAVRGIAVSVPSPRGGSYGSRHARCRGRADAGRGVGAAAIV